MKKIILLLVTFLEIYAGFAQDKPSISTADAAKIVTTTLPKVFIKLYPNPAKNKVELEISGFEAGLVQLQIVTLNGKTVRNDSRLLFSGNENLVVMFSLSPGVYFMVLKQKDKLVKKKMLVQ
jgi:hypothetical protein